MDKIWQMWSGGLPEKITSDIISSCEQYPAVESTMGHDGSRKNSKVRSSEIRWVNDNKDIHNILWDFAVEANRNAFGFDIDLIKEIQYTTYKAENDGKYDWHIDTFWGNPTKYDRKLSCVIQLTDPSEYEGGRFEFSHEWEQPDPERLVQKGTVIVFPSFIPHRVTPVTKGIRRSLVCWVEGPKFR